jgi:hypothetical protein
MKINQHSMAVGLAGRCHFHHLSKTFGIDSLWPVYIMFRQGQHFTKKRRLNVLLVVAGTVW